LDPGCCGVVFGAEEVVGAGGAGEASVL